MDTFDFGSLIKQGQEDRRVEYKQPGTWEDYRSKVVKCCLAMSNKKDGGFMVIGVKEKDDRFEPLGLDQQVLDSFEPETVQEWVNKYADPYVDLQLLKPSVDGRDYVVIRINEFAETPVICKKSHDECKIRRGSLYVRPLGGRPRSEEVTDHTDMRAVLDLAIDKAVEQVVRRCKSLDEAGDARDTGVESYEEQLGEL